MDFSRLLSVAALAVMAAACRPAAVDERSMAAAEDNGRNWPSHGRTYSEQRFSPLDQIDAVTVNELGLAWHLDLDTWRGQEATPLVIDGVMYFSTAWSKVVAVDAASGRKLWQFDPEVPPETAFIACCDVVNRGVAAWRGKIFVGTLDGRLIALEAKSGRKLWSVVTTDPAQPYTITGAPRVVKGKVLIGNGGADHGVRGYVSAYNADDGEMIWRFHTVPGNPAEGVESEAMAMAAETWAGEWWVHGGGGTVWDSLAYDPELDLLYVGVGNGSPWNHRIRSAGQGDNLFLASIVALRPDTGEYVWHYQTTPGETWDYTATQQMILADIRIKDQDRAVLMQAPKNGFFYVLDRATGELLSAKNFVQITWATHVDQDSGRPVEVEGARWESAPFLVQPSGFGAHSWHSMAYSPETGLVYIPAQDVPALYAELPTPPPRGKVWNTGVDPNAILGLPADAATREAIKGMLAGRLIAWDPVAQKAAWQVEQPHIANGGVLATAGTLVFQGDMQGRFSAYEAASGKRLWQVDAGDSIIAAPISYEVNGEQYIAVLAGRGGVSPLMAGLDTPPRMWRQPGRLLSFKLGGQQALPQATAPPMPAAPQLAGVSSNADPAVGSPRFVKYCSVCHGIAAIGGGVTPDLRYSPMLLDARAWQAVVHDGALKSQGMIGFAPWLDPEEIESVRAFVLSEARRIAAPAP